MIHFDLSAPDFFAEQRRERRRAWFLKRADCVTDARYRSRYCFKRCYTLAVQPVLIPIHFR